MMILSIGIGGGKTKSVKLTRFEAGMIPNLIRGVNKATVRLLRQIQLELQKGGTYKVGDTWVRNPSVHLRKGSGDLQRSWKVKPAKRVSNDVEGHVASHMIYSLIHEVGGYAGPGHSVLLPARPSVAPALKAVGDDMTTDITSEVLRPLR